jgi:hypothetical protein
MPQLPDADLLKRWAATLTGPLNLPRDDAF